MWRRINLLTVLAIITAAYIIPESSLAEKVTEASSFTLHPEKKISMAMKNIPTIIPRLKNSTLTFIYPDAVRGIYVNGHAAGSEKWNTLVRLINATDLNAMVIDVKDDYGNLTYKTSQDSPIYAISKPYISSMPALLKQMEKENIYPIARIVVFKDTLLATKKPQWSFMDGKEIWKNGRKEAFMNPFQKEVWDYNVSIAIEAAKLGFQEIQFDYVRFPEGFETKEEKLSYSKGDYDKLNINEGEKRVKAVSDFVKYAKEKLKPYGVKVSVDIFGYTATLKEAPGIGQNFSEISENVDVISSMIYPSHWSAYFGINRPDLQPYQLVAEYIKVEKSKLQNVKNPTISRPWLQDFTASWLGKGNFQHYEKKQIEDQIKALEDNGVKEFLLWNAGSNYTKNVDYTP
ncbi:putative glycoside hydrolase [Niallia sp. 03133]|uniref:putative glycoside hydrolase n=1 Tax=Niallia sp. 03133 TaxID=3458060 RepID=UPI004043E93B